MSIVFDCLQFFHTNDMCLNGECWMLLDPNENEQNAARLLKIWTPVIEPFKEAQRQALRAKLWPALTALLCCFYRACQPINESNAPREDVQLWTVMAAVPAGVLHSIVDKAGLIVRV